MSKIHEALARVRQAVSQAAANAGRSSAEVKLIAVSKNFDAACVEEAAAAGQLCFGENRVQEAAAKIPLVRSLQPLEWHLIGHLQSNKAKKAAALFDWVHSVDSMDLLKRLNEGARDAGKTLPVLVQVDLAREPTKSGIDPQNLEPLLAAAGALEHVAIKGLMVLPPFFPDPQGARLFFRRLRELRDELAMRPFPRVEMGELSMGMSHDFETAIQEGATLIRVGSAIFGSRE